jgi:glutamate formiminotransferase
MPLVACAVYVSSGLASIAARVAAKAATVPRVAVVDTFTDGAYARSSVKLVAEPGPLLESARRAAVEAMLLVDLAREPHPAPHPRNGAVDMISFMPLSEASASSISSDLDMCDNLAWELGAQLGREAGASVLMYGSRSGRTLLETRRSTTFFASCHAAKSREVSTTLPLDFGSQEGGVCQRSGITIVGTQTYVTNFNVQVEAAPLDACKAAASQLRSQLGVQVMALPHEGDTCEIGCNLQASEERDSPAHGDVMSIIRSNLPSEATILRSYVIGLTPAQAKAEAERLLKEV